jgi:hypothetical protein
MNLKTAASTLSVDISALTEEGVRTAAAEAIRAAHPDCGGDAELAPQQIKLAKKARDLLLKHLGSGSPTGKRTCPTCNGKGHLRVTGKFKATECPRCGGEGVIEI